MRSSSLLVFLLLPLGGCLFAQNGAATAEYSRQVMTATLRVSVAEQALADLEGQVDRLDTVMKQQGEQEAAKLETIEEVNAEIRRLRGEIEVMRFDLDQLKAGYEAYVLDQERRQLHDEARLGQLEAFLGVKPPPPPSMSTGDGEVGTPAEPDAVAVDELPPTVEGKLERAIALMQEGQQKVARAILNKAMQDHPDARQLDEVRYRLAETWFNEKDWRQAIAAFENVISNHPRSSWAPWAMLRQGECFSGLAQPDNARLFYEEVARAYPKSDAAKEAKRLLGR